MTDGRKHPPTPEQALALALEAPLVLVSASAGTGKTKTLVEKVIRALQSEVPLDRILAVTFTHQAAEELRQRLLEALDGDPGLRPQRLLLPQAYLGTIHGICARLLREHAPVAGIDPAFRILADPHDGLLLREVFDELFHRWYLGGGADRIAIPAAGSAAHREFLRLVELCGYRDDQEVLKIELERLLRLARVHPDPDAFVDGLERELAAARPPYADALAEILRDAWRSATGVCAELLRIGTAEFPDASFARQKALLAALETAPWPDSGEAMAGDLARAVERLRTHLAQTGLGTKEGSWTLEFPRLPQGTAKLLAPWNDLAKDLIATPRKGKRPGPFAWLPVPLARFETEYVELRPTLQILIDLLRQAMAAYERRKREAGRLDFGDLELRTRQLLSDPPIELRGRFDRVFVDEYQDVNRLQAEIVSRLEPIGGCFLVGDVKQCIYQFRLSDPSIFRDLCARATPLKPDPQDPQAERWRSAAGDARKLRVYLSRNFRAHPGVIDEVNRIFGALFTEGMIGGRYADEALDSGRAGEAARPPQPGSPPVEFHFVERPDRERSEDTPEVRVLDASLEARLVAQRLQTLVREGFPIWDKDRERWRPVAYGDMAVLLRSPGPTGAQFAQGLRESGIPVVFGGQGFFEREESRDFLSLLRILDNAHDDLSLAAVLRAPIFDFDDADLVRLRLAWPAAASLLAALRATATGTPDAWSGKPGDAAILQVGGGASLASRCRAFLSALDGWRARVQTTDLAAAVGAVLEASGLLEAAAAADEGATRVGNLQQWLALTREYCRDRDHSLSGLIRFLASAESAGGDLECVSADTETTDAVRLLSLHKAKGLEFPVVAVALTGRKFNRKDESSKLLIGEGWLGVDYLDPESYLKTPTLARRTLAHLRGRRTLEEELRLLYVGLTRARDKLIVSGTLHARWEKRMDDLALWTSRDIPAPVRYDTSCHLDWILGVLHRQGDLAALTQPGSKSAPRPAVELVRHAADALPAFDAGTQAEAPEPPRKAEAPAGPARTLTPDTLRDLATRLQARYAHEAATGWRGKYWATEIKRLADLALHDEERESGAGAAPFMPPPVDSLQEGLWLHAVLEEMDPAAARDAGGLMAQAHRVAERGRVPAAWLTEANLHPIAHFLFTPLAAEMRAAAAAGTLEREVPFTLKLRPSELARIWPEIASLPEDEWVLVQGQIDALWPRPDGTRVVIDFKSDRVTGDAAIRERATSYRSQMRIYREAVARLWKPRRVETIIYFLRAEQAVPLD
jgi:ATP-dependent helicase/nuclease subunit A